jgi:hypothetical protein
VLKVNPLSSSPNIAKRKRKKKTQIKWMQKDEEKIYIEIIP